MPSSTAPIASTLSRPPSPPRKQITSRPPSPPLSPITTSPPSSDSPDSPDSLLTRLILTPIRMISFLLSLALIDRRNRSYRIQQHAYVPPTLFGRIKQALFSPWQDPEPYRNFNPASGYGAQGGVGDDGGGKKRKEEAHWTWKRQHRKMMRLEVKDALEIRKRVVVGLVMLGVLSGVAGVLAVKRLWGIWSGATAVV